MLECISVWRYCDPTGFHLTPSHPQIPDQDNARRAKPGEPFTFTGEHFHTHPHLSSCSNCDLTVDASKTGWGEVAIDVVYENK